MVSMPTVDATEYFIRFWFFFSCLAANKHMHKSTHLSIAIAILFSRLLCCAPFHIRSISFRLQNVNVKINKFHESVKWLN